MDSKLPFYKLHSQLWFLIAIHRASLDSGSVLVKNIKTVEQLAADGQRHVLLRLFAVRILLNLSNSGHVHLSESNISRYENICLSNLGPEDPSQSKSPEIRSSELNDSVETESELGGYSFGIDFGPYWLAPLARKFGLSQQEIEMQVYDVIQNDLEFTGDQPWSVDERSKKRSI